MPALSTDLSSIPRPLIPVAGTGGGMAPAVSASVVAAQGETNGAASETTAAEKTQNGRPEQQTATGQQTQETSSDRAQQLQEQQVLRQLSARDREVRQHEMAHQAAGGGHTGGVSYSYERGPDGRMYAVGGEVSIDTSAVNGDPRATLEKAEAIIRAAMAPAEPSSQDHRVAASARAMAAEARAELARLEESEAAETDASTGEDPAVKTGDGTLATEAESPPAQPVSGAQPLNSVQRQLVETGAYSPLYPSGSLLDLRA